MNKSWDVLEYLLHLADKDTCSPRCKSDGICNQVTQKCLCPKYFNNYVDKDCSNGMRSCFNLFYSTISYSICSCLFLSLFNLPFSSFSILSYQLFYALTSNLPYLSKACFFCPVLPYSVKSAISVIYSTVLYCTILYCTVLYCTVLYCTVLHCTVLYYTVLYCTVLYCTVLYCTVLYCTVLYCTVLYCTVLYCTVLYCTVHYRTLPNLPCYFLHYIIVRHPISTDAILFLPTISYFMRSYSILPTLYCVFISYPAIPYCTQSKFTSILFVSSLSYLFHLLFRYIS